MHVDAIRDDLETLVLNADLLAAVLEKEELGKAALTELFEEARGENTPIVVERIVKDIDEIVRYVRFEGRS